MILRRTIRKTTLYLRSKDVLSRLPGCSGKAGDDVSAVENKDAPELLVNGAKLATSRETCHGQRKQTGRAAWSCTSQVTPCDSAALSCGTPETPKERVPQSVCSPGKWQEQELGTSGPTLLTPRAGRQTAEGARDYTLSEEESGPGGRPPRVWVCDHAQRPLRKK